MKIFWPIITIFRSYARICQPLMTISQIYMKPFKQKLHTISKMQPVITIIRFSNLFSCCENGSDYFPIGITVSHFKMKATAIHFSAFKTPMMLSQSIHWYTTALLQKNDLSITALPLIFSKSVVIHSLPTGTSNSIILFSVQAMMRIDTRFFACLLYTSDAADEL